MSALLTKLQAMEPDAIMQEYGYRADLLLNAAIGASREPDHFSMEDWVISDADTFYIPESNELTCGTTLCLAGWVVHQDDPKNLKFVGIRNSAIEILESNLHRLDYLFSDEYTTQFITATNVVVMIELFITNGQHGLKEALLELREAKHGS